MQILDLSQNSSRYTIVEKSFFHVRRGNVDCRVTTLVEPQKRNQFFLVDQHRKVTLFFLYQYTISKNDVIFSVRKRYCVVGLELRLGLSLGLAEIRFRSNVFSIKRAT